MLPVPIRKPYQLGIRAQLRAMGTIDVPIFYGEGDDQMEWVCWINDFCYDQGFSDCETQRFAYGFIEGEALVWYHEESSRSVFKSWSNLKYRLVMRFCRRPTQLEVTNLQERLRQISGMLDRWDEEDKAKKQAVEETWVPEAHSTPTMSCIGHLFLDPIQQKSGPYVKVDRWMGIQQTASQMDEPRVQKWEAPWSSVGDEESWSSRVEHYFERGKGVMEELFELGDTNSKEEYQQRKVKLAETEVNSGACKVLDQMSKGVKVTLKKKKKRWKALIGIQRRLEEKKDYERKCTSSDSEEALLKFDNPKGNAGHQLEEDIQKRAERENGVCHVHDKMHMRRKTMKKIWQKKRRFKYISMAGQVKKNKQLKWLLGQGKLVIIPVIYKCPVFGKRFMWRFTRRKKKRMILKELAKWMKRTFKHKKRKGWEDLDGIVMHSMKLLASKMREGTKLMNKGVVQGKFLSLMVPMCSNNLVYWKRNQQRKVGKHEQELVELLWGDKTCLKKCEKWMKHKFKQNQDKYKKRMRDLLKAGYCDLLSHSLFLWISISVLSRANTSSQACDIHGNYLRGVNIIPDSDIAKIVKRQDVYKNTSEIGRAHV